MITETTVSFGNSFSLMKVTTYIICSYGYSKMLPFIQISEFVWNKNEFRANWHFSPKTEWRRKTVEVRSSSAYFKTTHISIWQPSKIEISLQDSINVFQVFLKNLINTQSQSSKLNWKDIQHLQTMQRFYCC